MTSYRWMIGLAAGIGAMAGTAASAQPAAQSDPLPVMRDYPEGPRPDQPPVVPPIHDGQGMYWSAADLARAFGGNVGVHRGGIYAGNAEYSLVVTQRPRWEPAVADSEMHQDATQIYFIVAGHGTQYLGGKPAEARKFANGNQTARGPLVGATRYRIGPGDIVLIPPGTWHQTIPDPGDTVTYNMVHIHTKRTIP